MQDVGENMDDLFRKAADNYMLKEGESNWDEISPQLGLAIPAIPPVKQKKTKQYILISLLLLLFFAAGNLFNYYTTKTPAPDNEIVKQQYEKKTEDNINAAPLATQQNSRSKNKISVSRQEKKEPKNIIAQTGTYTAISFKNSDTDFFTKKLPLRPMQINAGNYINNVIPATADENNQSIITEDPDNPLKKSKDLQVSDNPVSANIEQPLDKDSTENKNTAVIKLNAEIPQGMYVGLLAGSGFNAVKNQHVTKPGVDIGIVAGYRFNQRSSVEIGLLYSKKHYYSDGKYFKMEKTAGSMPAGMTITSLTGHSTVFEIPVKFKYNVLQKNNSTLYTSAGVSSYLLTNEQNDYATLLNNTEGTMQRTYKKASGYIAGAFNLSAGYEHSIGKNNAIRIEPYITIPTTGVGIGSLPVSSSGIHFLFTLSPR
ncbi:hypothetical protein BH10BAC2_BH10BAC2_45510 [soil metagenome]